MGGMGAGWRIVMVGLGLGAIALAVPAATIVGEYIKLAVLLIFVFAAALGLWLVFRILWRSFRQESDLAHNKNPWKT